MVLQLCHAVLDLDRFQMTCQEVNNFNQFNLLNIFLYYMLAYEN